MKQLDYTALLNTDWVNQFDARQMCQNAEPLISEIDMVSIRVGLNHDCNVRCYIEDGYDYQQIYEIIMGLKNGVDVSQYMTHHYDGDQMRQIRWGLEEGLDVSHYADPQLSSEEMFQLRIGDGPLVME